MAILQCELRSKVLGKRALQNHLYFINILRFKVSKLLWLISHLASGYRTSSSYSKSATTNVERDGACNVHPAPFGDSIRVSRQSPASVVSFLKYSDLNHVLFAL